MYYYYLLRFIMNFFEKICIPKLFTYLINRHNENFFANFPQLICFPIHCCCWHFFFLFSCIILHFLVVKLSINNHLCRRVMEHKACGIIKIRKYGIVHIALLFTVHITQSNCYLLSFHQHYFNTKEDYWECLTVV